MDPTHAVDAEFVEVPAATQATTSRGSTPSTPPPPKRGRAAKTRQGPQAPTPRPHLEAEYQTDIARAEESLALPWTEDQLRRKEEIKDRIAGNLNNPDYIRSYGADDAQVIANVSKELGQRVLTRQSDIIGPEVKKLLKDLKKMGSKGEKQGVIASWVRSFKDRAEALRVEYGSMESALEMIEAEIAKTEPISKQVSALMQVYWDKNLERHENLGLQIAAAEESLIEHKAQLALEKANLQQDQTREIMLYDKKNQNLGTFERRVHTLRIQQQLAIVNCQTIGMIEQSNLQALDSLKEIAQDLMPMIRQNVQIEMAAGLVQRTTDLTNSVKGLMNSTLVNLTKKVGDLSVAVAEQAEKPSIEMATVEEVHRIQMAAIAQKLTKQLEGERNRAKDRLALKKFTKEYTSKVLQLDKTGGNFFGNRP